MNEMQKIVSSDRTRGQIQFPARAQNGAATPVQDSMFLEKSPPTQIQNFMYAGKTDRMFPTKKGSASERLNRQRGGLLMRGPPFLMVPSNPV